MSARAAVVVVLCSLAATAGAQPARYRRTPVVKIDVEPSERTRPRARAPVEPARPGVSGDDVLQGEEEVREIRVAQVQLLERLYAETPAAQPMEKADAAFRLADAYARLARFHRLEDAGAQIAADAARTAAERARLTREAAAHGREARAAQLKSLDAYARLVDEPRFASYARMHEALFGYGFTLQQAGDGTRARTNYHRLLTEFPQSPYAAHAYLAFADHFFERRELASAAGFYRKVLRLPPSRLQAYAQYMLGWVLYNQGDAAAAGAELLAVARTTAADPAQAALHRAAARDFVIAFAEFGKVDKAWPALQKLDAAAAPELLERLAERYAEQGKSEPAIHAFRQLVARVPTSPRVCAWQHQIAVAMLAAPGVDRGQKVEEIERLVRLASALTARTALPAAAARDCRADAAAMSGELARAFHAEAHKAGDDELAGLAERLYGAYLGAFADAADAGETRYYRAELAWTRADRERDARRATQRWEDAAAAFTAVVGARAVDPALRRESAAAAVDAWRNALAVDPTPTLAPVAYAAGAGGRGLPPPRPLGPRAQGLVAAIDAYLRVVPDARDPRRVELSFVRANVLRQHDRLDEALPAFEQLVREHPEHEVALYAANIVLDIHILAGRHDRVAAWARDLAARPAFLTARAGQDRAQLGQRVVDIGVIAARREAEELERRARKRGDLALFVACGQAYLTIFNDAVARGQASGGLDEVLYNAGVCFEDGRSLSAAIDVYAQLRERFPDAPAAARALARQGGVYARVAYYDRAAAAFEQYARRYAGEDDAYRALNDAVIYRRGLGDDDQAIADTRFFVEKFGATRKAAAADAFFGLGGVLERRGDRDAVIAHYRRYLARHGADGGVEREVVAHARIGQLLWEASCPATAVDGACVRITRERAVGALAGKRARGDATRTQCGPATRIKLTVVRRDPGKVAAARTAFAAAVAAYERGGGRLGGDAGRARHHYAQARLHAAEADYERFLAVPFPTDLDFDPARPAAKVRSDRRLAEWFRTKDGLAARAGAGYLALIKEVKDPATAIAAAARLGQIAQTFADALYTAEVPAFLRPYPEAVDEYCGVLEEKAGIYERRALEGYGACLDAATRAGWSSSWSRLCERELGQLRPEAYPTASELRAAPDAIAAVTAVEPAVASVE